MSWKRASFFPFLYSAMSQRTLCLMLQRYIIANEKHSKKRRKLSLCSNNILICLELWH